MLALTPSFHTRGKKVGINHNSCVIQPTAHICILWITPTKIRTSSNGTVQDITAAANLTQSKKRLSIVVHTLVEHIAIVLFGTWEIEPITYPRQPWNHNLSTDHGPHHITWALAIAAPVPARRPHCLQFPSPRRPPFFFFSADKAFHHRRPERDERCPCPVQRLAPHGRGMVQCRWPSAQTAHASRHWSVWQPDRRTMETMGANLWNARANQRGARYDLCSPEAFFSVFCP